MTNTLTLPTFFFVYGTLKTGGSNNGILRNATSLGPATTEEAAFRMLDNGGFPYTFLDGEHKVRGEIFEVTDERTVQRLDSLEGYPHHFDRRVISANTDDQIMCSAWMYFNPSASEYGRRSHHAVLPDENNTLEWDHMKWGRRYA